MTIERRYSGAFNVYKPSRDFGRVSIDTVFWTAGTVDEVRRSLISHDGYDSDIIVVPELSGIIPLTVKELEEICDDSDVQLVQATEQEVFGMWDWLDDNGNSCDRSFDTKEAAMRDALVILALDENDDETE